MKMTKIEIVTRASKLEELKDVLNSIGVLGMTVSQIFRSGFGRAVVAVGIWGA